MSREVHWVRLNRLCSFRKQMELAGVERATFSYKANHGARVEVAFVVDTEPSVLLIGIRGGGGAPYAFKVGVRDRCLIKPFLGEHYGKVLDALGVKSDPSNRFSTTGFFRDLEAQVPDRPHAVPVQSPELIARFWNDVEEADKVYFVGWVTWGSDGRHVTAENLQKTEQILGREVAETCRVHNISSRWSADPRDKRPAVAPDIARPLVPASPPR